MFDDDFFAKTSEALNGFFDSIEKSIKGLQKEVDSAKDKMKESAEKAKAENENVFKGDDVKEETAKTEAKADDTAAKTEAAGCDRSNVKLNYEKDSILITAKKEAPTVDGTVLFTENTCYVGKLDLKVRVGNLDAKSIHASYKDGVLRITAKRPQENASSGIKID